MDCQIPGRKPANWDKQDNTFDYGLEHLNAGQKKFAHQKANAFLEAVMMDPEAPALLKEVIRSHNAVGLMGLQQLLAAHVERELKGMF